MNVLPEYVCHMHTWRGQKVLELELQMVESQHIGPENQMLLNTEQSLRPLCVALKPGVLGHTICKSQANGMHMVPMHSPYTGLYN